MNAVTSTRISTRCWRCSRPKVSRASRIACTLLQTSRARTEGMFPPELPRQIQISLPDWIFVECDLTSNRQSDEDRMALAIELARRNVEHGGGPFGAVVFETATGRAIAPGVNRVVPASCSLLHAEVVALIFAQARLQSFTLATGDFELFTSSDPCI